MDDRAHAGCAAESGEAVEEARRLVATPRRNLGGAELALRRIQQEQVGEGAADVDPDDDAVGGHVLARAFAVASSSGVPFSRSTTL